MTLRVANITFDCDDALVVGRFWATALRRPLDPGPSPSFASIGRADPDPGQPNWLFARAPERRSAAKNRVHVDLVADDAEAEIARLVDLGAKRVADRADYGHGWTVMVDVEGNEFCVAQA